MSSNDPKPRIIAHMNREHTAHLKRYLRAFNGLTPSAAADAQLIDLTLSTLTITSASGKHTVPVTPPMKSLADARVRLVDMAEQAQRKLGLSDVIVSRFQGPRGAGIFSFLGVAFYFVSAVALRLGFLSPGTAAWDLIDRYFPYRGAEGFAWLANALLVPVLGVHVLEAWWMAKSRLAKYGVEAGSGVWVLWVLDTFVEGFPAIVRFDGLVKEERAKKEGVQH
ncbi:hypothetical protein GGS20DRAFT_554970 [Poronia punctata]|nr:hypothetical protein GGS20DRAFT_554970 [Poronia punctata]